MCESIIGMGEIISYNIPQAELPLGLSLLGIDWLNVFHLNWNNLLKVDMKTLSMRLEAILQTPYQPYIVASQNKSPPLFHNINVINEQVSDEVDPLSLQLIKLLDLTRK